MIAICPFIATVVGATPPSFVRLGEGLLCRTELKRGTEVRSVVQKVGSGKRAKIRKVSVREFRGWLADRLKLISAQSRRAKSSRARILQRLERKIAAYRSCLQPRTAPPPVQLCNPQAASLSVDAVERTEASFSLPVSPCGAEGRYEVVADVARGDLTLQSTGEGVYRSAWDVSEDSFQYRVCRRSDGVCGEPASVSIALGTAPEFSGNSLSLSPYRSSITDAEKLWLVQKLALNQRLLLEGTEGWTLERFVDERLLDEQWLSPDLRPALLRLRDRNASFATPNPYYQDPWITLAEPRPPMGTPTRYVMPGDELETPEAVRVAFDRLLYTTTRETHGQCEGQPNPMSLYEYYWSNNLLTSYLLMRARYGAPVSVLLTHFWLGHFGASSVNVSGEREHYIGEYVSVIEREALGSFERMVLGSSVDGCGDFRSSRGLICDPLLNTFLDNHTNTTTSPNQNFAREFMELFTVSPGGVGGAPANFSDPQDILAATAFLSGFEEVNPGSFGRLQYNPARHSSVPQTAFLSFAQTAPDLVITNQNLTPKQFASHVLRNHPATSRFIAGKLLGMLLYQNPSQTLIEQVASELRVSNFDIKRVVRMIALSEAMFSERARSVDCVEEPFKMYANMINGLSLPLLSHESNCSFSEVQKWQINWKLRSSVARAGEAHLAWPTIFSHDYCGESPDKPDKNGAGEWQTSSRLLGRITGLIDFIAFIGPRIFNDFTFASLVNEGASDSSSARQMSIGTPNSTPESVLESLEHRLGVELSAHERAQALSFLQNDLVGGGLQPVPWQPEKPSFLERKIAGLIPILLASPAMSVR